MKTAVNLYYDLIKDSDTFLECVGEAGFDGIDMFIDKYNSDDERAVFLKNCEKLKERLEKYNLKCLQVHLPFYNLFTSSEIFDEQVDKSMVCAFDAMVLLDCKWGAYHPRSSTNFNYDYKRAMEDNKKLISVYLEEAVKRNVGIAVENIPVFPDCPQHRFFSADYEDHIQLIDSLKCDNIGACWDFGHANLMSYDMKKVLGKMGDRIKIVHMHDNFRTGDHHLPPTMGTIDWDDIIPALKKAGFPGNISLEVNPPLIKGTEKSFYTYCADIAAELKRKFEEC